MACSCSKGIGTLPKSNILGATCQIQGYTLHLATLAYLPFRLAPSVITLLSGRLILTQEGLSASGGFPLNRQPLPGCLEQHSPDHSTFSRFRGRLSKEAMNRINSDVLQQFSRKGLTINEGVAVDARLVQSASHPISNEEIKKQREKRKTPEGKLDKNGNLLKFSRDLDSDWIIKNDKPHYGLKEHAAVDVDHGFVLSTDLTPASVSDTIYLPHCIAASCHTKDPIGKVYADKGYYGEPNRNFLHMNGIADGIMRRDTKSTKLTDYEKERNKGISKKRYIVEQYFGLSHLHSRAFRARFDPAASCMEGVPAASDRSSEMVG
jgi:IS5 family transposase